MNHDNEYHDDVNYGNKFPTNWYLNDEQVINTLQTQDDYKNWNKPNRTLNNYWLIMTLIYSNTNTSRNYLTCNIVTQIAQFNRVKPSDYHQFNKTNRKVLSNIKLASFFNPW